MTFGEMQQWTARFLQIIGGAQCLKVKRLTSLKADLEHANEGKKIEPYLTFMYAAVIEEMEG